MEDEVEMKMTGEKKHNREEKKEGGNKQVRESR